MSVSGRHLAPNLHTFHMNHTCLARGVPPACARLRLRSRLLGYDGDPREAEMARQYAAYRPHTCAVDRLP